jgi:hypothetical protein
MMIAAGQSWRMTLAIVAALAGMGTLAACTTSPAGPVGQETPAPTPASDGGPRILDQGRASILRANSGLTLQWISWDFRGPATVQVEADGRWHLTGSQRDPDGGGFVRIDGHVTEVGHDYFVFDGEIVIEDTPDAGRRCRDDKTWTFGITQNRSYWRLREFEWCDGLTDYIDIYF